MVSYTLSFVSIHPNKLTPTKIRARCVARSSLSPALQRGLPFNSRALNSMNSNAAVDDDFSYGSSALNELQLDCVSDTLQSLNSEFGKSHSTMDPELLSEFLMETGALSVVIEDADKGTEDEQPIFNQPSDDGESWYRIGAVQDNFWRRCTVTAYYHEDVEINEVIESVVQTFTLPAIPRFVVNKVPDRDWIKVVQQGWPPIIIGSLLLRFPWHTEADVARVTSDAAAEHELVLEGGMAFGTGEHATTQLCCSWLERTIPRTCADGGGARVLDYGAGSGVLGLAALRFGASSATGVEIDRDSIIAARANAALNSLRFPCYLPSAAAQASADVVYAAQIRRGRDADSRWNECHPLPDGETAFDIVVANILADPLRRLAPELARLTRPGGRVGLSGVLKRQAGDVVEAYAAHLEDVRVADERLGWVLITGRRPATGP